MSFTGNGDGTGTLSGAPGSLAAGSYPLTITASNAKGSSAQSFTLTVTKGSPPPPDEGTIAGRITDANGRPLKDVCAHVFLTSSLIAYTGNNYAPATYQACSNSDGYYDVPLAVPGSGRYSVQFIDSSARYQPQWYGDTSGPGTSALKGYNHPGTPVSVTAAATTTVNATMKPIPSGITVNTPTEKPDGAWQVTGTITVTNDNNVPLTGVTVADAVSDPGAKCSVPGGTGDTIAASPAYPGTLTTKEYPYTCAYSSPPRQSAEVNTATVTWTPNDSIPNDSYQYRQSFSTRS